MVRVRWMFDQSESFGAMRPDLSSTSRSPSFLTPTKAGRTGEPSVYFLPSIRLMVPVAPLPWLGCRGGAGATVGPPPSAAYIACVSRGDWWNPANACGAAGAVGKKLPNGVDGWYDIVSRVCDGAEREGWFVVMMSRIIRVMMWRTRCATCQRMCSVEYSAIE